MQSPRGNKRDSCPRTSPRFRNRKETGDRRKKSRGRFAGETQRSAFQEKGSATGEQAGKAAYERTKSHRTVDSKVEKKATIPTSEGRSAKITEEQNGRDRYVGGEAVPRRGNSKWSEKEKK